MPYMPETGSRRTPGAGLSLEEILALIQEMGGVGGQNANPTNGSTNPMPAYNLAPGQSYNVPAGMGVLPMPQQDSSHPSVSTGSNDKPFWMRSAVDNAGTNDFLSNIMGTIGGIGDMFGGGGNNRPAPGSQQGDELDAMLQQLMAYATASGSGGPDIEQLMRENSQGIRESYQPQIGQIRQNNVRARRQTRRDTATLDDMYSSLAKNFRGMSNQQDRHTRKDLKHIQNITDAASNRVNNSASNILNQQAALMNQLGQEDVAGGIGNSIVRQNNQQNQAMQREASQNKEWARSSGNTVSDWFDRSAGAANLEGTNRGADLVDQLGDILAANNGQIADLRGQMGRDITTANSALQTQYAENQADTESEVWDRLFQLAGLKQDIEENQDDNAYRRLQLRMENQNSGTSSDSPYASNMQDASSILAQLKPKFAGVGQQIINSVMQSSDVRSGQTPSVRGGGDYVKTTPEQSAYQAAQLAKQMGLPDGVVQQIWNAAYAAAS